MEMDMPHLNKQTLYMEQPSNDPIKNTGEIKTQTILKRKIQALISFEVKPNNVSRMKMHRGSLPPSLLLAWNEDKMGCTVLTYRFLLKVVKLTTVNE